MDWHAGWICPPRDMVDAAPLFSKEFAISRPLASATLQMTALGVYEACINGKRVSEYVLAPGFTSYAHRLQVQRYDVTAMLEADNEITVLLGKGWYRSPLMCWQNGTRQTELMKSPAGITAELTLTYQDGSTEQILTDTSWLTAQSPVRFSELYGGEVYDATFVPEEALPAVRFDGPSHTLIAQEGPEIREQEHLCPARIFITPKGECVIDFGQEVTGFLALDVCAKEGDVVDVSFGEVLDRDGNFYNDNYRGAACRYTYICREGRQQYKTRLTFYGYRYVRVNQFPGGTDQVNPGSFSAIVVHSQLTRTGWIHCSDPLINRLFSNVIWGQKGNFLDVPTDCPQRDERFGWAGDAQVFVKTACLNYDVETFFAKWLSDLAADQHADGYVGSVIPDLLTKLHDRGSASAAWGDAATICPWEVYLAYGNADLLRRQFPSMCRWVDHIGRVTTTPDLWTGGWHYGDWLGLDAPSGSYKGSSREDFIASAFYAHSTDLVIRAGRALGEDVTAYEQLYKRIVSAFRRTFTAYATQTECGLAAHMRLAESPQAAADQLAGMIRANGTQLQTGFVGTPYLLHVLSTYGYTDLAYELLLRKAYPSWLYPITKGATTIWEHWDGVMEDGSFWSRDMNSFNHYAYGAVADWIYCVAAGIQTLEHAPGYQQVRIAPHPTPLLDHLEASVQTRHGLVSSKWINAGPVWRHEITTPVKAHIVLDHQEMTVSPGSYVFFSRKG